MSAKQGLTRCGMLQRSWVKICRELLMMSREAVKDLAGALGRALGDGAGKQSEAAHRWMGASMRRNPALWLAAGAGVGARGGARGGLWVSYRAARQRW